MPSRQFLTVRGVFSASFANCEQLNPAIRKSVITLNQSIFECAIGYGLAMVDVTRCAFAYHLLDQARA